MIDPFYRLLYYKINIINNLIRRLSVAVLTTIFRIPTKTIKTLQGVNTLNLFFLIFNKSQLSLKDCWFEQKSKDSGVPRLLLRTYKSH